MSDVAQGRGDDARVTVVGGGLAGCECALSLADAGVAVRLVEMRPTRMTEAHTGGDLAELVCSNSLKAVRHDSAAGLLKEELDLLGCHLVSYARDVAVPAGGALAVDRALFSQRVGREVAARPLISVERREVHEIPRDGLTVIAAGPLCAGDLAADVERAVGGQRLSFYDAAAPIVDAASLDMGILFAQSRYERGEGADYLNAPLSREEYEAFVESLVAADRVILRDFERRDLFQACQPVEEVARTGRDALRFGALKPVGIQDPRTGRRPCAVVQLRAEDRERKAYNLVGFQTNLTFPEQRRVFGMIPGLRDAEYFRYGVMHRNTFIDAPHALDDTLALRADRRVRFAGQITGTEGYVEAMATGRLCALGILADLEGSGRLEPLPKETALGSLIAYATDPQTQDYQPMHVNFGIVPALEVTGRIGKRDRYRLYADRALQAMAGWIDRNGARVGIAQ